MNGRWDWRCLLTLAQQAASNRNTRAEMATSAVMTCQSVLITTIICFVWAYSTFSHPRLRGFVGSATKLCAFSSVSGPIFTIFKSEIPNVVSAPNLSLSIFFQVVGNKLAKQLNRDDELLPTFLVAIVLGTVAQGCGFLVISRFRFCRVADSLPYPVLCGYFAIFGSMFFRAAVQMQPDAVSGAATVVVASIFCVCQMRGRIIMILPISLLAVSCFYVTVYYVLGRTTSDMRDEGWLMPLTSFDSVGMHGLEWYPWVIIFGDVRKVRWIEMYEASVFPLGSMMFLLCLKETIVYDTFERNSYKSSNTSAKSGRMRVRASDELNTQGVANVVGGLVGGIGTAVLPALVSAQSTKASGVAAAILMGFSCFTSFAMFAYIPKFLFAGFLAAQGIPLMINAVIKPFQRITSYAEFLIIPLIVGMFFLWGIPQAIAIGAGLSVLIFTYRFHEVGVIKYEASAVDRPSSIDRDPFMRDWLDEHGDSIWIIHLTGYLFFGNTSKLLRRIQKLFTAKDRPDTVGAGADTFDTEDEFPQFLVLDFPLVGGIDAKSIEVLLYISKITRKHNCVLCLSGVTNPDIRKQLERALESRRGLALLTPSDDRLWTSAGDDYDDVRNDEDGDHTGIPHSPPSAAQEQAGQRCVKKWEFKKDVDSAVGDYEDEILQRIMTENIDGIGGIGDVLSLARAGVSSRVQSPRARGSSSLGSGAGVSSMAISGQLMRERIALEERERRLRMLDVFPDPSCTGFAYCLKYLEKVHRIELHELLPLTGHTTRTCVTRGTVLMNVGMGTAIDFNRTGGDGDGGLYFIEQGFISVQRDPNQSTDGRRRASQRPTSRGSNHAVHCRNFRLTRLGPGQVIGALELTSGYRSMGLWEAATDCILHYLPFTVLVRLEKEDPVMLLRVHKLLGRIVADRYDKTKEHVTGLVDSIYSDSRGQSRYLSIGTHRKLRGILATRLVSPSGTVGRG
jgi:MFS superfamily sulfate permease-like transporter/CRP-like cAMP-binding protein